MDSTESIHIGQTPHASINSSGHDSVDSGYLTFTPHSTSYSSLVTSYKMKSSVVSAKRHHRLRVDPWQRDRAHRYRSKFTHLLNASESDFLISESTEQVSIHEPSCISIDQSLGLVHSTPSCTSQDLSTEYHKFGDALRSKTRKSWRTAAPVTLASTSFQLLSPPPSPPVPSSSYVAAEPIQEDIKMKLVLASETITHIATSSLKVPIPRIIISPTRRRSVTTVTSADNQKLSKLSITDFTTISEIKPKRLDFDLRTPSIALRYNRTHLDYIGKERVDFLSLLGEESNHLHLTSKILSLLGPQDLCSVSMVSKIWKRICENDLCANKRRICHILRKQNIKENLKLMKKVKMEEDIQTSPKSRYYVRKGYLLDVQNLQHVLPQSRPPRSPPVSPSKVKFHSFVKASRTLARGEHLLACPRCTFPCHVDGEKNVGTCSRQGCSIQFCTSCSSKPHMGPCKTPLLATPTKRNKRLIVGSRQSKRNLRRL